MDHIVDLSVLEKELGQILKSEQECAGVYHLIAQHNDELIATEYYAVADTLLYPKKQKHTAKNIRPFGSSPKQMTQVAGGLLIMNLECIE